MLTGRAGIGGLRKGASDEDRCIEENRPRFSDLDAREQTMDRQSTIIATGANPGLFGPTLGEISAVIERRLPWYTLLAMTLDAVELRDGNTIVVYLGNTGITLYREVIDVWTGCLVRRDVLPIRHAGSRASTLQRSYRALPTG